MTNKRSCEIKEKRIIVVLGMHRSGTSAITRGLLALGVDLGTNLISAMEGNNEKGFWEDLDINSLDVDMLRTLNRDWDTLVPLRKEDILRADLDTLLMRAEELLREKTKGKDIFGMKDPRLARLLPFWKIVFERLGIIPCYVIALRHPMSIVRSLEKRDGFNDVKSYYLLLDHMISSIVSSRDGKRVVVDYDRLLDRPVEQLQRIARALDLKCDITPEALEEYTNDFLEERLRHTRYNSEDLLLDPHAPKVVVESYAILRKLSRDEIAIDAPEVVEAFDRLACNNDDISPALSYMTEADSQLSGLKQTVAKQAEQHIELNQAMALRMQQITMLTQTVTECNCQMTGITAALAERVKQIDDFTQALVERDEQIDDFMQALVERDKQIDDFTQALAERDRQIRSLEIQGNELEYSMQARRNSISWKVKARLRLISATLKGHLKQERNSHSK